MLVGAALIAPQCGATCKLLPRHRRIRLSIICRMPEEARNIRWQTAGFCYLARLENGGRSSMVELQVVVLAVAGSSPVGHPFSLFSGRFPRKWRMDGGFVSQARR